MGDLLWKKSGTSGPDAQVMKFLAGEDVVLDRELLLFDLRASAAHANGLEMIGVLSKDENTRLQSALATLAEEYRSGNRKLGTDIIYDTPPGYTSPHSLYIALSPLRTVL